MPRIILINLGHFATHLLILLFPVVAALAADEFGESYGTLITLSTGGFVLYGLGAFPAGWLADRWSRDGMMAVFFIGSALGCFLTGMADNFWQIAGGLMVLGLFASIYHPVGISILTEYGGQLGRRLGINGVAGNVGIAVSTISAAWLAGQFGWRAAFMVPGAISLILGLMWILVNRRRAPIVPQPNPSGEGSIPLTEANLPSTWKRVLIIVVAATIFGGFAFNGVTVSLPELFEERLGELTSSALGIGGVAMVIYMIAAGSQILVGNAIDRYPIRPIFLTVAICEAVAMIIAVNADGYLLIGAALFVMVTVFGAQPIGDVLIARHTPQSWRGRFYAANYLFGFGAAAAAVPVVGGVHSHGGGFVTIFILFAACALAVMVAAAAMPRHGNGMAAASPAE